VDIIFRNVDVPASPHTNEGIEKTRVVTTVDGETADRVQDIAGNGGKVDIVVPLGSSGGVTYGYVDAVGNVAFAPVTRFENAQDKTAPTAPEGGLVLPPGDSLPE
jgi:hypothetical protein